MVSIWCCSFHSAHLCHKWHFNLLDTSQTLLCSICLKCMFCFNSTTSFTTFTIRILGCVFFVSEHKSCLQRTSHSQQTDTNMCRSQGSIASTFSNDTNEMSSGRFDCIAAEFIYFLTSYALILMLNSAHSCNGMYRFYSECKIVAWNECACVKGSGVNRPMHIHKVIALYGLVTHIRQPTTYVLLLAGGTHFK